MADQFGPWIGVEYDPETGIITRDGERIIACQDRGYYRGRFCGRLYYAHRVAWFLYHGEWPKHHIDHINGNGLDNRISNLRDVPNAVNAKNLRPRKCASGISGIYKVPYPSCWNPQVSIDGKSVSLGSTPCLGVAIRMRRKALASLGYHENHGRAAHV